MKLSMLLDMLTELSDKHGGEIEVAVEGFDDNFYDGDRVSAVRVVEELESSVKRTVVFIITEQGREVK